MKRKIKTRLSMTGAKILRRQVPRIVVVDGLHAVDQGKVMQVEMI